MAERPITRRRFLRVARYSMGGALAGAAVALPAGRTLAEWMPETPAQPAGPFYARLKPLIVDNDLVFLPNSTAPAAGERLHLTGRIMDQTGRPVPGARVEIWQANTWGRYKHPLHANSDLQLDPNFQGFGHDLTDEQGVYRFRTVKPGAYPDRPGWLRPPHIHFAVFPRGGDPWATQMYFPGEPLNATDFLFTSIIDADARERLVARIGEPLPDMEPDSKLATFDIVLGLPGVKRSPT